MSHSSLYGNDFPEEYRVKETDIIKLIHQKDWDSLNDTIVCRDNTGKVTARFGQHRWDLSPIARTAKYKDHFDFELFNNSIELQMELKVLAYGWLFNKRRSKSKAPKFTTLDSRMNSIKTTYEYLYTIGAHSLSLLSDEKEWDKFKNTLVTKDYSQSTLEKVFSAISNAIHLEPWLKYSFGFAEKPKSTELARKLSDKAQQQILVIPERLGDHIYGKAIELINEAFPHKELIAKVENELQENYLNGKYILDENIKNGEKYTYLDHNKNIINNHKYFIAITDYLPKKAKDIIQPLQGKINSIQSANGNEFRRYTGQLLTACYIACGAFSGMRDSELDKLTPESYYKDTFEGRDYHMIQSHTFKLGEKRETWVAAPIAEKAIELASVLTESWRKEIQYPNTHYKNTLWCSRTLRSKEPVLITNWNGRLQLFCNQFSFIVTEDDFQECINSNPRSLEKIKKDIIVGKPWPLTTHQFRRSLAFYCVKNRLGTLVALKQQFKHLYLAMTEWYTNGGKLASLRALKVDPKVKQILKEINAESTTSKIFKHWHTEKQLSGTHGKAIMKMRGDIPHIYSSWETIYQAVLKGTLTLHGTAHSYCKNGYKCDMDGVVMPQFCVGCESESSIIDKEQAEWWQKRHKSLVRYMSLGENISHTDRSHYITQIRAAEIVMNDFEMEFTSYEHEIKVMTL